ncbi:MAG: ferrochelatase [Pseudomonadota bacterium]
MPFYLPEPPYKHDQPARVGVLLVNLGTPAAPTAEALRPYLKEFLWDRRVVEIPRPVWWLILNGIILNTRPRKSAAKYASIWRPEGSPLKVFTERMTALLKGQLEQRVKEPVLVDYAMRYGEPDVAGRIAALKARGVDRLLVLPLYPQYAASSTGSALDAVWQTLRRTRNPPALRAVRNFHDHPGYIQALRQGVEAYWAERGRPDVLVMSFHGVPRRSLDLGDPYHCECRKTGRLLAEALGLAPEQYRVTFQSRFGRAEWLKPYTSATLEELGHAKTRRVDVICPGFVADCLETLEEIGMEGKAEFLKAGGGEYHYIPALNDRPLWIAALADLVQSNLAGWLDENYDQDEEMVKARSRQERAHALEAKN